MGGYAWLNETTTPLRALDRLPNVDEIAIPVQEQFIVELYSK
jgi:ribosomal protein S4